MRILLIGNGKMGQLLNKMATADEHEIIAVIGSRGREDLLTVGKADVIIDFSHPDMLPAIADYALWHGVPLCCGTTGYSKSQMELLRQLADSVPVLYSANFSLGIAVFRKILSQITPILSADFDIEIVETHHNEKVDAPSGTAKLLADSIDPEQRMNRICGRSGQCGKRPENELGIFSLRGGTVNGTHTVSYFGEDETLSITHSAASRRLFASGAYKTALSLACRHPGWYELEEILFSE